MPLYEYRCSKCERVFEVIQKFSDAPLTAHENCGGAVERLISAAAFQFKGSGWYVTDYARGGGASKSNGESKNAESGDSKKASDSKPAETKSSESSSSSSAKADAPAAKT